MPLCFFGLETKRVESFRIEIQRKISDKKCVGDQCGYVVWVNQFNCGSNFLGLKKKRKKKKAFVLGQTIKIAQLAFKKKWKNVLGQNFG